MGMTREEAKTVFLNRGYVEVEGGTIYDPYKWIEACAAISEWLKQESCEEAISRQAVLDIIDSDWKYEGMEQYINDLPLVNSQRKIGRWIDDKCSVCGKGIEDLIDSREWYENEEPNFCPFCGVKLEEEEE